MACKEDEGETPRNINSTSTVEGQSSIQGNLLSSRHLAEVSSHIIASKFRISNLNPLLPSDQGSITIKTSFLHIQPRKVIVHLPVTEDDSGIDSESEDIVSNDTSGFLESDLSLDSLSSLEELAETRQTTDSRIHAPRPSSPSTPLVIHSKTPTWNEQHMIYQLDFGGRVTTKSAKNFQLEMESEQVREYIMFIVKTDPNKDNVYMI